ncbi:hypothetical protein HPB50_015927 [Hyalomma asiaticum]|uniref:Uncharacterized protein n=1 Tax=Hyalomma asiaticum TaxID=266040 RepID=A0ACB7RTJ5_HYAAI|nr:hypothetical protein HPB50_015927 [Hyalomma asiaticum]
MAAVADESGSICPCGLYISILAMKRTSSLERIPGLRRLCPSGCSRVCPTSKFDVSSLALAPLMADRRAQARNDGWRRGPARRTRLEALGATSRLGRCSLFARHGVSVFLKLCSIADV